MKRCEDAAEPTGAALNRESYDAIASEWAASRKAFYGREREYLDELLRGLPEGADVLDLGCGSGRPIAEYILLKRHRVTGVDQSGAMLAIARARFPDGAWILSSIQAFAPPLRYDAIVCWDTLFHLDRVEHGRLFQRFARMLNPGGRLMLTFGGSDQPPFTDTMFGRTFFYDSHPPGKAIRLLVRHGFTPVISEFMNPPIPGRDKGRYAVVARLE